MALHELISFICRLLGCSHSLMRAASTVTGNYCKQVLITILTVLLAIALPIILIGSVPLLLYRKLHEKWIKIFYSSSKYEILHPAGQTMVSDFFQPNPILNIIFCSVLEGHLSTQELKQLIQTQWLEASAGNPFPEVQKKCVCIGGYYYWIPIPDFNVNDYVQELKYEDVLLGQSDGSDNYSNNSNDVRLNVNRDESHGVCSDTDLKRIVAYLTSKSWRKDQSPWEFYVIHNYHSDADFNNGENSINYSAAEKTVVLFRTHHFFVDGYSILNLILSLVTGEKSLAAIPTFNSGNVFMWNLHRTLVWLSSPRVLAKRMLKVGADENDWRICMNKMSRKCYTSWTRRIPVSDIKLIKAKYGVSFQAVLQALVGRAVGQLMERAGQSVPKEIRAVVPIPLPNRPGGLENYFTFACPTIPITEPDVETRLKRSFEELKSAVKSAAPIIAHPIQLYGGHFHDFITSRTIGANPGNTIAFTSFPGINGPAYFCGHLYLDIFGTIGTSIGNAGASLTAVSCFGKVTFGITIDTGVFPSQEMLFCFDEFIDKEIEALLQGSLKSETSSSQKK